MPELYDRRWDAPRYVPDVITINLGTNDFAQGDPGPSFVTTYVKFVKKLRGYYPNALVLCGIGPMLSGSDLVQARSYVQAVVRTMNADGDAKVATVDFAEQVPSDGLGCGGHPNVKTHRVMADALTARIKELARW
jgi:lysophospholipase L1-like esterase